MLRQPGRQISGAAEIEQRVGQGLQPRQRQGLDAGDGGFAQAPAAATKQSEGHCSSLGGAAASFAFLAPLQTAFLNPILGEPGMAQVVGGDVDQGHDFLASELGKPLPQNRDNNLEQVGAGSQDLLGGFWDLRFGQHWQGEQAHQRIKPRLLTELLQAEPVHAGKKRLQLKGQLSRAKVEAPVGHHDDHPKVLHLRVQLQKAKALSCKPVLEPWPPLHLHLEQHHRLLRRAVLTAARPEHAIAPERPALMPSEGVLALHNLHRSYAGFAEFQPELPGLLQQGTLLYDCITVTRELGILEPLTGEHIPPEALLMQGANYRESLVGNGLLSRRVAPARPQDPQDR